MTQDLDLALRIRANIDQASRSLNQLKRLALSVGAAFGAAFTVNKFVQAGIQFNSTLETSRLGIASLIDAQSQLTDSTGRLLTGQQALQGSLSIADDQVQKLRIAGIQTSATFEQLAEAYQQALGPGLAAGLGLDQVRDITVQIVQAAGALGLPMNQVSQEVRAILGGTIDMNARIANALGITNAMVASWKQQGTLVAELNKRLEAFKTAGDETAKTWESTKSNLEDAVSALSGEATRPLFDSLKQAANDALNSIFDVAKGAVSESFTGLISVLQRISAGAGDALSGFFHGLVSAAQALSGFLDRNQAQVNNIFQGFRGVYATVSDLLAPVGKAVVAFGTWLVKSNAIFYSLRTVQLIVAGIKDGFTLLGAAAAYVGGKIIDFLATPIQYVLDKLTSLASFIGLDISGITSAINDELQASVGAADQYAKQVYDDFAAGRTEVQKTIQSWDEYKKKIDETGAAADKASRKAAKAPALPTVSARYAPPPNTQAAKNAKEVDQLLAKLREQQATFGQTAAQIALYRLKLLGATDAQMAEAQALTGSITALKKKKELQAEGVRLTESLRTAQEVYDAELAHYQQLLATGAINQETFNRAVAKAKDDLKTAQKAVKGAGDVMDQFAVAAARSIQGTLADFFNGFKGGLKGLVSAVADTLQKIAAQIAAADLAKKLFGADLATGKGSDLGGWIGQAATFVAGLFHSGGIVGAGGGSRAVSPLAFIGAPHFATGGVFGLGPDEMPAIVHRREEILTPSDPRHRRNGGLSRAGGMTVIQNITTPDASSFHQSAAQIARDARLGLDRGRLR